MKHAEYWDISSPYNLPASGARLTTRPATRTTRPATRTTRP
ncbi:hypothetical protein ACFY8O_23125 [Streptomyces argenteolus]|uniref:Uncharacterized protein n=1 Tax=Streptomyces argenteolus TaxID=67274 RepID=A0ABW6XAN6_9ACTN